MPITAKLSRRFYEQFGDDIVDELVNLLNTVDATSRSELRELNELNFARFDAKLEQRIAELRAELRGEIHTAKSDLHTEIHSVKAELVRWMFLFWSGTMLTLGGLLLAVLRPR